MKERERERGNKTVVRKNYYPSASGVCLLDSPSSLLPLANAILFICHFGRLNNFQFILGHQDNNMFFCCKCRSNCNCYWHCSCSFLLSFPCYFFCSFFNCICQVFLTVFLRFPSSISSAVAASFCCLLLFGKEGTEEEGRGAAWHMYTYLMQSGARQARAGTVAWISYSHIACI